MTSLPSTGSHREISILLVDDQPAVRCGLRMLFQLEAGAVVVGEASSAGEAMTLAAVTRPDLVIMDVEMPGLDGIAATEQLIDAWPTCVVVILTIHNHPQVRARAFAAGAWAVIEKCRPEDVRTAFRQVINFLDAVPQ